MHYLLHCSVLVSLMPEVMLFYIGYPGDQNVDNSCAAVWPMLVSTSIVQYTSCDVG